MRAELHPVYTKQAYSAYKSRVYQSIDEELDEEPGTPLWVWPVGLTGLIILALAGWVYVTGFGQTSGQTDPVMPEPEAQRAYLRALGETNPALRRARLTDFLNQHSQNPRAGAASAQLAVLDAAADADWLFVVTQAQDIELDIETRRTAVLNYREEWGRYLGARDDEIDALLKEIETSNEVVDKPDRALPQSSDNFPGVPDDRLLGGPAGSPPPVIYRPTQPPRGSLPEDGVVIAPRVVRNATPRYPRRAQRRGVEAIVVLSLNIDAEGKVAMVELVDVQAERYAEDFVKAAERAALRTRFRPKTVGGVPTEAAGIRKRYRFESEP